MDDKRLVFLQEMAANGAQVPLIDHDIFKEVVDALAKARKEIEKVKRYNDDCHRDLDAASKDMNDSQTEIERLNKEIDRVDAILEREGQRAYDAGNADGYKDGYDRGRTDK